MVGRGNDSYFLLKSDFKISFVRTVTHKKRDYEELRPRNLVFRKNMDVFKAINDVVCADSLFLYSIAAVKNVN